MKSSPNIDNDEDLLDDFFFTAADLKVRKYLNPIHTLKDKCCQVSQEQSRKMSQKHELSGRKNRAFAAIKTEMEEKERQKKSKGKEVFETVTYVDAARNMAVLFGERDVKTDVKAKNRFVELLIFLVKGIV